MVRIGPGGFETISGEVVNVGLFILCGELPETYSTFISIDANDIKSPYEKAKYLRCGPIVTNNQLAQLKNPDARIIFGKSSEGKLLKEYADSLQGVSPADFHHYGRCFWELAIVNTPWFFWQSTVKYTLAFGGREHILWMNDDFSDAIYKGKAYIRGKKAWGKSGVIVSLMGSLPVTLYTGEPTDTNVAIILPKEQTLLPSIWAFCLSEDFNKEVRKIDKALKVTNGTLEKIPFHFDHWQKIANSTGALPKPISTNPNQWLFKGFPVNSTDPLQVLVARLLGYHWPQQNSDNLDAFADEDGIVCLTSVCGEPTAVDRLRTLLAASYAIDWSLATLNVLLSKVGYAGKDLAAWLRDSFFSQHCKLFHNRPFIWQIWDGRKDGFSVLVNYHKLDAALLEKLIYTYLGDWIRLQRERQNAEETGAEGRLVAGLGLKKKLEAIREGEPPYDIYIRWKPLYKQPIGWNPDLNDGVRLNIRPFVIAGILRSKFSINWGKDRGKNSDGSKRWNNLHYSNAQKREAREAVNGSIGH